MSILDRAHHRPEESAATTPAAPEDAPEQLPGKTWATIILFAVFVVAASGCVVGHLIR